ncbi:MAG: zinc ribbon domain-containing protein, partial [Vicinamibacteria bacterium]
SGGEIHDGAHKAIVDEKTWNSVAHKIKASRKHCGRLLENASGTLLLGLLRCGVCGAPMTTHSARRGDRQFRYYVCSTYQKRGAAACPGSRAAVAQLDAFVVEQVRKIGKDPRLLKETIDAERRQLERRNPLLLAELKELEEREVDLHDNRRNVLEAIAKIGSGSDGVFKKLTEIESEIECVSARIEVTRAEIALVEEEVIEERDLEEAIATFDPVWEELFPGERLRIFRLLIEKVTYNDPRSELKITFEARGVRQLSAEGQRKEA